MTNLWFLISVFVCLDHAVARHEVYKGYKVYQIKPNIDDFPFIQTILNEGVYDFWKIPRQEDGEIEGVIMVGPSQIEEFESRMKMGGVSYEVQIEDLVRELQKEDEKLARSHMQQSAKNARILSYNTYYRHEEINAYLDNLGTQYPNLVTIESGENSYEGREIKYVKISTSNFTETNKPVIVMDALMHAREWITLPVATYIIDKLIENSIDADLIQNVDWIIVPVANPDGYEYTHDSARLWRKTRSTNHTGVDGGEDCIGVDGNRNFDYHWGEFDNTLNPCLITYGGPNPFSEPETRNIRNILLQNLERIGLYISIHSYGNMFLYPWAFDGTVPSNSLLIHLTGLRMARAIDQYAMSNASRYVVGNSAHVLYYGTGISKDYAQLIGVDMSYTLELPGYEYMFQVPPEYIEQVVTETWEGIKIGARDVVAIWTLKSNTSYSVK